MFYLGGVMRLLFGYDVKFPKDVQIQNVLVEHCAVYLSCLGHDIAQRHLQCTAKVIQAARGERISNIFKPMSM